MSSYTKAKVWDQVYSTMVNLPSGIASTASALNAMNKNSINRDLEKRYEEYQAFVDYADSHSVNPAYKSMEGYIQAASEATGIDRKFIKNVLDSVNWDPTRTNNSTLTDWMVQNGYGTNSWKRNYITKKISENSRGTIIDLIETGMQDFATNKLTEGPYTFFENERSSRDELRRLCDAQYISESTGMSKEYVQSMLSDGGIMETINKWYDEDYTSMLRDYEDQQNSALISTQTKNLVTVNAKQAVSENQTAEQFINGVYESINKTGYNVAFGKYDTDMMISTAISAYMAEYAVEFTRNNFALSDYEFRTRFFAQMEAKRDEIVNILGDKESENLFRASADTAVSNAYTDVYTLKKEFMSEDEQNAINALNQNKELKDEEVSSIITIVSNNITSANANINNGMWSSYSEMSFDDYVNHVSGELFKTGQELLDFCNENGKTDLYSKFTSSYSSVVKKVREQNDATIEEIKTANSNDIQKSVNALVSDMKDNPSRYSTWSDDDIAMFLGFEDYESYMDSGAADKQQLGWFEDIRSALSSAKTRNAADKKSEYDLKLGLQVDDILSKMASLPFEYYKVTDDEIASIFGYESYKEYLEKCNDETEKTLFNKLVKGRDSAKSEVDRLMKDSSTEADKVRDEQMKVYKENVKANASNIISYGSSGVKISHDDIANMISLGMFSSVDEYLDNADSEMRSVLISTINSYDDEFAKSIGIDMNSIYYGVQNALIGNQNGLVSVSSVSYKNASFSSEFIPKDSDPSSYDKDTYGLFNNEAGIKFDYSLNDSSVEFYNPFELQLESVLYDYQMSEGDGSSLKIYGYDEFVKYAKSNYGEMLNNPEFMKTLVKAWNKTYCSIPTSDEAKKAARSAIESEAWKELTSTGNITSAQKIFSSAYDLYDSPKDYADAYNKLSLAIDPDVNSAVSEVEGIAKSMIPSGSTYSSYRNAWTNIPASDLQKLQSDIMRNPDKKNDIISDFVDSSINRITEEMATDYYKELKSIGSLYAGFGGKNSESIANGPQLFSMMVDDRFYVGKPDNNTFSVLLASMKNDPAKNIYDVATSMVYEGSDRFEKLEENQQSIVHSMVAPVAYAYTKMSFMSDNAEKFLGVKPDDMKYVVLNNDIALVDTSNGNIYSIPSNSSSASWTVCRPTYAELQNIKNSSDSLYVVKETDGASYGGLNLDEIKKLLVKNNVSFPNNGFGYAKLN